MPTFIVAVRGNQIVGQIPIFQNAVKRIVWNLVDGAFVFLIVAM